MVDYEGNDYEEVMENTLSSMDNVLDQMINCNDSKEESRKENNK
jgi:hypothetical protein